MTHAQMRQKRTETILAAAKDLVLKEGIGANLMTSIAKRSGISRQRLYQYYSNLDDVLIALLVDLVNRIYTSEYALFRQYVTMDSASDALTHCLKAELDYLCSDQPEVQDSLLLLSLLDVYTTKNRAMLQRDTLAGVNKEPEELIRSLIRRGQTEGTVRRDISADTLEYCATELLLGYAYRINMVRTDAKFPSLSNVEIRNWLVDSIMDYIRAR